MENTASLSVTGNEASLPSQNPSATHLTPQPVANSSGSEVTADASGLPDEIGNENAANKPSCVTGQSAPATPADGQDRNVDDLGPYAPFDGDAVLRELEETKAQIWEEYTDLVDKLGQSMNQVCANVAGYLQREIGQAEVDLTAAVEKIRCQEAEQGAAQQVIRAFFDQVRCAMQALMSLGGGSTGVFQSDQMALAPDARK